MEIIKMNLKKIALVALSCIINLAHGASSRNKIRILPSEQKTFDQMKAYNIALDYHIPIDPEGALRTCVRIGPDRASTLLKGIIKRYPKYRAGILKYLLKPKLHNQNYAFPFNPMLKPVDSSAAMPLIKYMADLGNVSARAAHKAYCLKERRAAQKKRAQEQAQKNADFWAEKKELREGAIRKQEKHIMQAAKEKQKQQKKKLRAIEEEKQKEQEEQELAQAKSYTKQAKYNRAYAILSKLANDGSKKAIVEQGKIHQELMYKAMVQQATAQHATKKTTSRASKTSIARKRQIQKRNSSSGDAVSRHRKSALKLFKNADAHGCYYTAKFCESFAQFYEDTHHALAQAAFGQASLKKQTTNQQKLIDAGKKKENAAIALWHNKPNIYNMQAAKNLERQAATKYNQAAQKGDSRGLIRIGTLHERLCDAKSNIYRAWALETFKEVKKDDPNYAKALTHLACLHAGKGLSQESIELLKRACLHDHTYRKPFKMLANLCDRIFKREHPDIPTIEDFVNFMIKHGGETAQTHNILGKCAMINSDETQAIEHFVKAGKMIESATNDRSEGWHHAGIVALKWYKSRDAKTYFKKACNLNGNNAKPFFELGDIYAIEGNDLKARQHYAASAGLGDSNAHHKIAKCFINGNGGIYNPELATHHYAQSVVLDLPFSEQRKRKMLTQISKLQTPSCEDNIPVKEAKEIQKMVLNIIKEPIESLIQSLNINEAEANKLKAEALSAQANLYRICARRMQQSIGNINLCGFSVQKANQKIAQVRSKIEQLKIDYVKNKDAISLCIARITKLTHQVSVATNYRQEIMHLKDALKLDPTNARFTYNIASRLQYFFPKKKLSEMTQSQKQECDIAHGFYLRVIKGHAKNKPDNFFVYNARCNLGNMLKHLYPDNYKDKIVEIFTMGSPDEVRRNINIARAHETGLLSDDGKPDYQSAANHIAQALKLKPKKQYLRKEYAFYTYASNPSAPLSKVEQAFILELTKILNGNPRASNLGQRLEAYNRIDMGNTDILIRHGYDANGKPIYIVKNGTVEQRYACSSSNSTK